MIEPSPTSPAAVELGYDPWSPAFVADPYPALARLRAGPSISVLLVPSEEP